MKTNTIRGTYGSALTPCDVFTATTRHGYTWYVVAGSVNVNLTPLDLSEMPEPVDVETLPDVDTFTAAAPIESEEELETAIEE